MQNALGWAAIYHDGSIGTYEKQESNNNSFQVYPSPADRYLNIFLPETDGYEKLFVNDFTGKIVIRKDIISTDSTQKTVN